jgi:hypothetical protein
MAHYPGEPNMGGGHVRQQVSLTELRISLTARLGKGLLDSRDASLHRCQGSPRRNVGLFAHTLDERVFLGETAVVAPDRILDEVGNHLPVGGSILRPYTPAEIRPDRVLDPSFELVPCALIRFSHVVLAGWKP